MKAERPYPQIAITPKGEEALTGGHPWVYEGEVTSVTGSPADGNLVDVVSRRGSWLGAGFYNSRSLIRVRLLSRNANDRFDADFWARRLTRAVEDMADYPAVYKAYGDRFLEVAQGLEALRDKAAGGWDSLAQGVPSFRRMGVAKGEENAACRERAKAVLEQAKKALKDIQAIFSVPEAELLEDLRQMAPAMLALLRLTAQFTLSLIHI